PDTYVQQANVALTVNPQGPESSYDPREPTIPQRGQRGGSYLCDEHYCASYRPSARMKASPDTSLPHVAFRCGMATDTARKTAAARTPDRNVTTASSEKREVDSHKNRGGK